MPIATINPATGEILRSFEPLTENEIEARLQRAVAAFDVNRLRSLDDRAVRMLRAAQILEERAADYGRTITLEMGKPIGGSVAEVKKCALVCRYYAENAARFLADEPIPTDADQSYVRYEPLGPVLAVMPWNFPFWQVFRFAAPALMAGNVGLLKHSSNVPQCALAIEEIFRRAGFDDGVFQTLLIGSDPVEKLIADPRIAAVTLTGSEGAGRSVAASAGKHLKKSVVELGGSDPFVVMPSADLDTAVSTAVTARMINNGQSCIAAKRFIVHADIYEDFLKRFVAGVESIRIGDPMEEQTQLGPLATGAIRDELHVQVQSSVAKGARVLTGGQPLDRKGFYYAPTVVADIPPDAPAAQ